MCAEHVIKSLRLEVRDHMRQYLQERYLEGAV